MGYSPLVKHSVTSWPNEGAAVRSLSVVLGDLDAGSAADAAPLLSSRQQLD